MALNIKLKTDSKTLLYEKAEPFEDGVIVNHITINGIIYSVGDYIYTKCVTEKQGRHIYITSIIDNGDCLKISSRDLFFYCRKTNNINEKKKLVFLTINKETKSDSAHKSVNALYVDKHKITVGDFIQVCFDGVTKDVFVRDIKNGFSGNIISGLTNDKNEIHYHFNRKDARAYIKNLK